MSKSRKLAILSLALLVAGVAVWRLVAGDAPIPEQRTKYTKAFNDGKFKVAYDGLRKLALDPKNDPLFVGKDLELAIQSLMRLRRNDEVDAFRDSVIKIHEKNWRLLQTAAHTFVHGEHYGFMIAGEYKRGGHRGGGQ